MGDQITGISLGIFDESKNAADPYQYISQIQGVETAKPRRRGLESRLCRALVHSVVKDSTYYNKA